MRRALASARLPQSDASRIIRRSTSLQCVRSRTSGSSRLIEGMRCLEPSLSPPLSAHSPSAAPTHAARRRRLTTSDAVRPVYQPPNAPGDAPVGMSTELMTLLEPCRRRALATWPDARRRFQAGLPAKQALFVTTRLRSPGGRMEQSFVAVDRIDGTQVTGRLWSEITAVAGYRRGQTLTLPESEIVDWTISREDGSEEGNWIGEVHRCIPCDRAGHRPVSATRSEQDDGCASLLAHRTGDNRDTTLR